MPPPGDYTLTPVEHDPWAEAQTHQAERPNPAAPIVNFGKLFAKTMADRAISAVTAPRDALYGNMQVTDPETGMPTREAMERGRSVANLAMTGGMPCARQGAAGMAGGRLGPQMSMPSKFEQLEPHYSEAVQELGTTQIPISELVKRSGLSKEAVHKELLDASKRGDVNLYAPGFGTEEQLDAAIHHPAWNDPVTDVVFGRK
jgi:hypothetical protein